MDSGGWVLTSWLGKDRFHLLLKGVRIRRHAHCNNQAKRGMRFIYTHQLSSGEIFIWKKKIGLLVVNNAPCKVIVNIRSLPGAEMTWFSTFSLRSTSEIEQQYNTRQIIIFLLKKRIKEISRTLWLGSFKERMRNVFIFCGTPKLFKDFFIVTFCFFKVKCSCNVT